MIKTLTLYPNSSTGDVVSFPPNSYNFRYEKPVTYRFDLPEAMRQILPTSMTMVVYVGGSNGTTGSLYSFRNTFDPIHLKNTTLGFAFGKDPVILHNIQYAGAYVPGRFETTELSSFYSTGHAVYAGMDYIQISPYELIKEYQELIDGSIALYGPRYTSNNVYIADENSDTPPYLQLTYNTKDQVTITESPIGFVDENAANTFAWRTTWSGYPIEDIEQQSAVLEWKVGESGTLHTINLTGSLSSYIIPAGTFPESNDIRWRVTTTTAQGETTSVWRTIMTTDSIPVVTGVSPSGAYIDNTNASRFTWNYSIETGTEQQKFVFQVKYPNGDWQTVLSESTSNTFADVPAGTLLSGQMQWRVRGYNSDMVPSDWSAPLSCVVIATPSAPEVVVVDAVPRALIRWTAQEQQAYEVKVGSYDSGLVFGSEKSCKIPIYLSDGQTSFYVRVMNSFGYWSEWGSASANITNIPSSTLELSATSENDAILAWETVSGADKYRIFRDGVRIKDVNETAYTDKLSTGTHTYQVYALLSGEQYYTPSNVVSVDISVDHPIISALDGEWISAEFSLSSLPSVSSSFGRDVYLMQYDGHALPEVEVGEFRSRTYQLNVAFASEDAASDLEELVGRIVVVKNQYGDVVVGVIGNLQKTQNIFTVNYTGTLTEIDRSEYENS